MPTGKEVRQYVGINYQLAFPGTTTDAATSASAPIDFLIDKVRLQMTPHPVQFMQGQYIRFTSGTIAGHQARIVRLDPSTGTLVFSPGWSGGNSIASGVEYEIWQKDIVPDDVDRFRDYALVRTCSTWQLRPVTLIPDGDLMKTDTSDFTPANATLSKVVTPSPPFTFSHRYLQVDVTLAGGSVTTSGIPALSGQTVYIEVPVKRITGTGTVTLSGSTAITGGVTSVNHNLPVSLNGVVSPSTNTTLTFQLASSAASTSFLVGPIACHYIGQQRITLPARITTRKRAAPGFAVITSGGSSDPFTYVQRPLFQYDVTMDRYQVGTNVELRFYPWLMARPYYYFERSYFEALQTNYFTAAGRSTGDAAVTTCPIEYIGAATAFLLAQTMRARNPQDPEWQTLLEMAQREMVFWEREFGPEPRLVQEEGSSEAVPTVEV